MSDEKSYRAVVDKVVNGKHGAYAVTRADGLKGSVTFSLDETVWQSGDRPEPGTLVLLSMIRKKRAGWRAQRARVIGPSDEQ
ncbi:MAG: hypothetical protein Q8P82_00315 [bacterium]|nr:hypothetical protein [bacterium]